MSGRWLRLTAAFVASPLLASALAGLAVAMIFYDPTEEPFSGDALTQLGGLAFVIAVVSTAIALPTTLSIGLIAHSMFQRRGVTSVWAYILVGAIAGALVPAILTLFVPSASIFALYGTPVGAMTALFIWLIRRPDCDMAEAT